MVIDFGLKIIVSDSTIGCFCSADSSTSWRYCGKTVLVPLVLTSEFGGPMKEANTHLPLTFFWTFQPDEH